jgi:hypothetical protein
VVVGILAFTAAPGATQAQQVTVTGLVVERTQSSWIGGATVQLSGASPFFTNLDGTFQFDRVTPGRHTLTVEAMGYQTRSMELDLRSDTILTIEMDPDPILLDSLLVRAGDITIKGEILDARTGAWILFAQVTVQPGLPTVDAYSGRFTVRRVPVGRAVTVLVEAVEYLPVRIALITETDTSLTVELEPDPVGIQLIAEQIQKLETRSNRTPYPKHVIDREDMALTPGWTIYDMIRTRLNAMGRGRQFSERYTGRMACLFIDEVNVGYPSFLKGLTAGEVDRVEIYKRGNHIRVYTKRFLINMLQEDPGTMFKLRFGFTGWDCG